MKTTLIWTAASNCPASQLTQIESNRFAIVAPYSTYIKSLSDSDNYIWEDGELLTNLDAYSLTGPIQVQQGIRLVNKYLVKFTNSARRELVKYFNQAGFIQFIETDEGFLLSNNVDITQIENLEGVTAVGSAAIVQRKKYKPTLINTGIFINKLPWHLLSQPASFNPFKLASDRVIFSSTSELQIALYPVNEADYSIVREGEVIAELMLFTNNKEVKLVREDSVANVI
jgi:hypothetical protein